MTWETFHHEAMATDFAIYIAGHPADYARQAATACWRELDRLENELSRFLPTSDISRINRLARGETTVIGEDVLQCLILAANVTIATHHAFDPAYASQHASTEPEPAVPFTLDPDTHTLTSQVQKLHLDLGAIGKGYALDVLAQVLADWQITTACLQSGGSTALILDAPEGWAGWTIGVGDDDNRREVTLTRAALSGSGVAVKGQHVRDPRTRQAAPRQSRVWALAETAALSDALSTAFFVLSDDEVAAFCEAHPDVGAAISRPGKPLAVHGSLHRYLAL